MLMRVSAFATVPAPIEKGSFSTHVQGGPGWCCVIRAQVCGLLRNVIRKPRRGQESEGKSLVMEENPPRRSEPNNNPQTRRHPPTPTPSSVPHACIVFVFCSAFCPTPLPSPPPSPCLSYSLLCLAWSTLLLHLHNIILICFYLPFEQILSIPIEF